MGYEAQLWLWLMRFPGSMDAAEFKHVVIGLLFSRKPRMRSRSSTPLSPTDQRRRS
jgi:hypothetical protein